MADRNPSRLARPTRPLGAACGALILALVWACGSDNATTSDTAADTATDAAAEADAAIDVPVEPGEEPDAQIDAPPADLAEDEDMVPPVERRAGAGLSLTGGGGVGSSANYRIRLAVGPPMPVAQRASQSYILILGPQALHP